MSLICWYAGNISLLRNSRERGSSPTVRGGVVLGHPLPAHGTTPSLTVGLLPRSRVARFSMANLRRRDGLLNAYGAGAADASRDYEHHPSLELSKSSRN